MLRASLIITLAVYAGAFVPNAQLALLQRSRNDVISKGPVCVQRKGATLSLRMTGDDLPTATLVDKEAKVERARKLAEAAQAALLEAELAERKVDLAQSDMDRSV